MLDDKCQGKALNASPGGILVVNMSDAKFAFKERNDLINMAHRAQLCVVRVTCDSSQIAKPPACVQGKLPPGIQTHFRSIITDGFLRVKGSNGTIYAIGDAATIEQVLIKTCIWLPDMHRLT